jgi:hypothetical protein
MTGGRGGIMTRKITGLMSAKVLASCGAVAVLALPGTAPAMSVPLAHAGTAAPVTSVGPARAAAYTSVSGRLFAVSAVSATNAWAVGDLALVDGALIMHWNGTKWRSWANPPGGFAGVAARSATDAWAVGECCGNPQFISPHTLAMHWNGRTWSRVLTPTPKAGGYFNAVSAASARDAWAVGAVGPKPGTSLPVAPLIEHWTGRHWTVQPIQPLPDGSDFTAVAAVSAGVAWAVGSAGGRALAEHWNGAKWNRWAIPDLPGAGGSRLTGVTMTSATYGWAAGFATMPDGHTRTLTAFWNGVRWRLIPSPNPGYDPALLGVTASGINNIWAVGDTYPTPCEYNCAPYQTLVLHWNGVRWTVVPSPSPPCRHGNQLFSLAAVSRDYIWAAGNTDYSSTLIVHWNGHAWS